MGNRWKIEDRKKQAKNGQNKEKKTVHRKTTDYGLPHNKNNNMPAKSTRKVPKTKTQDKEDVLSETRSMSQRNEMYI